MVSIGSGGCQGNEPETRKGKELQKKERTQMMSKKKEKESWRQRERANM